MMIDATDLAAMQTQMSDTHTAGTCVISRRTKTTDGQGGYTWTYPAVTGGTVLYRQVMVTGIERAFAQRFGTVTTWRFGLPLSPAVLPSDRLVMGSVTYEVTSVDQPRTIALEQLVECVKL